jgi:hypothetical protein
MNTCLLVKNVYNFLHRQYKLFRQRQMARKQRKMALYEVIGKTGSKPRYDKLSEQSHPQESDDHKSDTTGFAATSLGRAVRWPRRPRMLLFNAGRVEISLPYQLAVAILLGFVLLILVAFRLGQNLSSKAVKSSAVVPKSTQTSARASTELSRTSPVEPKLAERPVVEVPEKAEPVKKVPPTVQKPVVADAKGSNNKIVIQTWRVKEQLEPVKEYFTRCGIETEIINEGDWYYLVTKGKYDNPDKPGTNGYTVKQKIIELGANYQPPAGSANFGTQPFRDAYGKRFNE